MATEFARIGGSYSTAYIGRYEVLSQNKAGNYTTFRLYGNFYYGGSTSVGSSSSTFTLHTSTIKTGSYRYYPGETQLGTVDINVAHNPDGSFPSTYIGISANSYHITGSTGGYLSAPDIPRQANITSAPDFNDEGNPTVNYSNPAGDAVSQLVLSIHDINGSVAYAGYRDVPKTGTSYTFNLTDDERVKLRQACTGNSMQVKFYLRTTIDDTYYYSSVTKTMTIVNGNPTFDNFNFADVNSKTLALTGNSTSIVKGYSNVKVTIPSSMKATANKEATLSKYRVSIGTANPTDITYSSDNDVNGTVNNADSSTINVYAIDSRNNSKLVSKQSTNFIPYSVVTKGNIDVGRTNGVSEDVTLKIDGTFNKINFGTVINSIKYSKYRYRVKGTDEWSAYNDLTLTVSEGNYSYDGLIKGDTETLGFNVENSYEIEVLIKDELSETIFTDTFGAGIPNIALAKNGVGIMGAYDEDVGGLLQVGGKKVLLKQLIHLTADLTKITWTSNWEWQTIPMVNTSCNVGQAFEYDEEHKGIKVLKNIHKAKISGQFNWYNNELDGDKNIRIQINNSSDRIPLCYVNSNDTYSVGHGEIILTDLKVGDFINLAVNSGPSGSCRCFATNTYLEAEVVEE